MQGLPLAGRQKVGTVGRDYPPGSQVVKDAAARCGGPGAPGRGATFLGTLPVKPLGTRRYIAIQWRGG